MNGLGGRTGPLARPNERLHRRHRWIQAKLKALQSGDRVTITIDTNDPPHHILWIRGTAEVTEIQGVVKEYAQAAARHLGKGRGEAYVGSLPPDIRMGRIAVRPDQVVILDFETASRAR